MTYDYGAKFDSSVSNSRSMSIHRELTLFSPGPWLGRCYLFHSLSRRNVYQNPSTAFWINPADTQTDQPKHTI